MDKEEILKLTADTPHIIGVAPNAFSRVVLAEYFPHYSIVCFKNRQETDFISRDIEVFCAEKVNPKVTVEKMNAGEILNLPEVKKFISSKNIPHLIIYKPSKSVETLAYQAGWKIIGNSATVKYEIENKLAFRNLLNKCGIESISGETIALGDLNEEKYKYLIGKWGPNLVFQVCEITSGGGTGTAFISNINDFRYFIKKFEEKKLKLPSIENVNITKFIEGVPASISACATKFGVITGKIQTQILDVSEVRSLSGGSGLFSGHDFTYGNYDNNLNRQARDIAVKFGEYIYKHLNYKGIFGLDLIVNANEGKVFPVECNPRYTDAFPLISQINNKNKAIPMDVFHVFEHLGVDYKINVDEISDSYSLDTPASQILLENRSDDWMKVTGELKAGIYQIVTPKSGLKKPQGPDRSLFKYSHPGYRFEQLKSGNEFLVTEGVPFPGSVIKGGSRIMRLVFARSILDKPMILTEEIKEIINQIYDKLQLEKTDPQILIENFLGLKYAEITDTSLLVKAVIFGADVVNFVGENQDFGYVRPKKIRWAMVLKGDDPFKLIKAKKLRKHLKNWLSNIESYGLKYEVKDSLTSKDFAQWFKKYSSLLTSKEKANININQNWLLYKTKAGKRVGGVFIYKGNKLLGGNIFIISETGFTITYGIVEKIKYPNWSLGAIADFISVRRAFEMGYKTVGFGQDNNLYGYHLSQGLLQYKLNFGLTPNYKDTDIIYTTKFIDYKKFKDSIIFLGIKDSKKIFYILKKISSKEVSQINLNTDLETFRETIK